ncbi:MAG: cytochrome-c oxidase, cbb3-type subunit II [Candidatus Hydrogenedentota bacterium]|nr:MAG: cytochrome-c oxidase, cbb3-type subunit II [Candidatus Hydrogenedentota bacterium]
MENQKNFYEKLNEKVESKGFAFTVLVTVAILIGTLVELPPFFLTKQVEPIESVKPYNALELAGRDVYQKEGCFNCHTQMIRPFKWETDRFDPNKAYGPDPYSKAGEYVYDHPFLWGSKRTGPDLAHEASIRPSAAWHKKHLINPRETSPGSIMPAYPWLFENELDIEQTKANMRALRALGVPYTDEDIAAADKLLKGKTEGDAVIAYLLKLGRDTMVQEEE